MPPAGAELIRSTVQSLAEPALRLVGSHDSVIIVSGPMFKVAAVEIVERDTYRVAVIVTLWLLATEPAAAVKVPERAPGDMATDAGMVNRELLVDNCTVRAEPAIRFNSIVQVLELPETTDVELQLRVIVSGTTTMMPPVAVVGIAFPAGDVLIALAMPIVVPVVPADIVTLRTATTPFWMGLVLRPPGPIPIRKQV